MIERYSRLVQYFMCQYFDPVFFVLFWIEFERKWIDVLINSSEIWEDSHSHTAEGSLEQMLLFTRCIVHLSGSGLQRVRYSVCKIRFLSQAITIWDIYILYIYIIIRKVQISAEVGCTRWIIHPQRGSGFLPQRRPALSFINDIMYKSQQWIKSNSWAQSTMIQTTFAHTNI